MATGTNDPMAVVEELNAATNANDLDAIVDLFTDDGVIRVFPPPPLPDAGIYTGKAQIRAWFEPQLPHLYVEGRNYHVDGTTVVWDATVRGDVFQQMGIDSFDVTAQVIVQDSKIAGFTVEQSPETVAKFQTAMQQQTDAAQSDEPV